MAWIDSSAKGLIARTARPLGLLAITALAACATQAPPPAAKAAGPQATLQPARAPSRGHGPSQRPPGKKSRKPKR